MFISVRIAAEPEVILAIEEEPVFSIASRWSISVLPDRPPVTVFSWHLCELAKATFDVRRVILRFWICAKD